MELATLGLFSAMLLVCVVLEKSVLWALAGLLMIGFFRQQKAAGWLLVPYLLWLTFAGYLSFMVARLNP